MSTEAPVFKFSVEQFERMAEVGIFGPEERVELVDGEIYDLAPIGVSHAWCVDRLVQLIGDSLGGRAVLRVQNPAVLSLRTIVQPDLLLLRGPLDRYRKAHPQAEDVLLLIEVSDTTIRFDRRIKLPIYARTGIAEAWIIDLQAERVEIYREPSGDGYASTEIVDRGGILIPHTLPNIAIGVDQILP